MKKAERFLLFLTLLFLPTQLGKHFWPEFSFVYSLPIDYLSPTIYFWDLLVILLVTTFLLSRQKVNKLALDIFLLFLLTQMGSLVGFNESFKLGAGLVRAEQYLISGLFGVYLASKKFSEVKNIIIWGLGLGIFGESLLAISQFLKGETIGFWIFGERTFTLSTAGIAKFDYHGTEFLRPYATFPHPNVLAAFMVIASILLSSAKGGSINKIANWTATFAAVTIVLTVSRASIIAGVVSAIFLLHKRWKIVFILILTVLMPVLYTRFSSAFNFDSISILRREELTEAAIELFYRKPLLGVGLNNFIPEVSSELLVGPSRFLQPVHNIFLLGLAETGFLGLLGLLGLIILPMWAVWRAKNMPLLNIWLVIIFLGLFDHFFLTLPQGYRMLFLIWGISLSAVQLSGEKYR